MFALLIVIAVTIVLTYAVVGIAIRVLSTWSPDEVPWWHRALLVIVSFVLSGLAFTFVPVGVIPYDLMLPCEFPALIVACGYLVMRPTDLPAANLEDDKLEGANLDGALGRVPLTNEADAGDDEQLGPDERGDAEATEEIGAMTGERKTSKRAAEKHKRGEWLDYLEWKPPVVVGVLLYVFLIAGALSGEEASFLYYLSPRNLLYASAYALVPVILSMAVGVAFVRCFRGKRWFGMFVGVWCVLPLFGCVLPLSTWRHWSDVSEVSETMKAVECSNPWQDFDIAESSRLAVAPLAR